MDAGTTETRSRDIVLDFWRGASIALVVFHHLVYFRYRADLEAFVRVLRTTGETLASVYAAAILLMLEIAERVGSYGVKFFFVISGYLITKLMMEEEERKGSMSLFRFYARRVFRILPAYVVYLLAVLLAGAAGLIARAPGEVALAGGFMCNTGLGECGWATVHTWTLAIEEQFYIVWPLVFLLIPQRFRTSFLATMFGLLILASANGLLVVNGWLDNALAFACIAAGALYAASGRVRTVVTQRGVLVFALLALAVAVAALVSVDMARVLFYAFVPALLLIIIMSTYRIPSIVRTRVFSLVATLGLVSYSLYLWQQVFLAAPDFYTFEIHPLITLLLIPVTLASYFLVEKPAIRWGKLLLARHHA